MEAWSIGVTLFVNFLVLSRINVLFLHRIGYYWKQNMTEKYERFNIILFGISMFELCRTFAILTTMYHGNTLVVWLGDTFRDRPTKNHGDQMQIFQQSMICTLKYWRTNHRCCKITRAPFYIDSCPQVSISGADKRKPVWPKWPLKQRCRWYKCVCVVDTARKCCYSLLLRALHCWLHTSSMFCCHLMAVDIPTTHSTPSLIRLHLPKIQVKCTALWTAVVSLSSRVVDCQQSGVL